MEKLAFPRNWSSGWNWPCEGKKSNGVCMMHVMENITIDIGNKHLETSGKRVSKSHHPPFLENDSSSNILQSNQCVPVMSQNLKDVWWRVNLKGLHVFLTALGLTSISSPFQSMFLYPLMLSNLSKMWRMCGIWLFVVKKLKFWSLLPLYRLNTWWRCWKNRPKKTRFVEP